MSNILNIFTDSDIKELKELLGKQRRQLQNARIGTPPTDSIPKSSDVFVALPQVKITSLVKASIDGASSEGDIAGVGVCDIFRVIDGQLIAVEVEREVYNLSENEIGREWITVIRTRFGEWIIPSTSNTFMEFILYSDLAKATGPFTGATAAEIIPIKSKTASPPYIFGTTLLADYVPGEYEPTQKLLIMINRAMSMGGSPGTYGQARRVGNELRLTYLDCAASEEGIQIIVLAQALIISGGFGSGGYGSGTYGG